MAERADLLIALRSKLSALDIADPGERWLVGYSGGADSTALVHLLRRDGRDVVAAHLHHGQRAEADSELDRCRDFCAGLSIPFVSGHADVPAIAREMGIGLEEAGREARYDFFRRASKSAGCVGAMTAHTRTDLVETVLLNLTRGSGLAGLAGIPERRGSIVRPLLGVSRTETRAYCKDHGLWFHDDPANTDERFSRFRIRANVLPELQHINPAVEIAISRLSETAREEDDLLNAMAASALERCEIELNGVLAFLTRDIESAFAVEKLIHMPDALLKRAVRLAFGALGATLDREQTVLIADGVKAKVGGAITADGGRIVAEWTAARLLVRKLTQTAPFEFPLTVPGDTLSDELGWRFTAQPGALPTARAERQTLQVAIPYRAATGDLYFRSARPADRMRPLGFDGSRRVSDLLSESGLTSAARGRLPIVCDSTGPLWIPGVCLDARAVSASSETSAIIVGFGPVRTENDHN